MKQPGETGLAKSGPGFDNAVRACLVSGVVLVESERKIATLTPEASEMLGFRSDQPLEQPVENLPSGLLKLAAEVQVSGKPASSHQVPIGKETAWVSAIPVKAAGAKSMTLLTVHKINTGGEFLQRIQQLDRLANAGTLAAGMAHEIKNALVACRTFLDLLLEKNSDQDLVTIVRRENGRIDAIVSRMLRFAGTNASALNSVHVHEVLENALRLVQPQMAGRSLILTRSLRAERDTIRADEYELHQAFMNLLLNALESMGTGGTLSVSTGSGPNAGEIEIRIGDTGTGILPEHIDRLFEPFFTTKQSGTGLGLAVTKRIVQEHGGSIDVRSQPGQGTMFSVVFPLLEEHSSGTQAGGFAPKIREIGGDRQNSH